MDSKKKKTAAIVTGELQQVSSRHIAVSLEIFPVTEPHAGAVPALQYSDGPALRVCLHCRQQGPVPLFELCRDPETIAFPLFLCVRLVDPQLSLL